MAAARLAVAAAAMAVAAALPLVAAGAGSYDDCFEYCFGDCMAREHSRSKRDYCNYACDKTCAPDDALRRPLTAAGGPALACQVDCIRKSCRGDRAGDKDLEACYGQCYDGCKSGRRLPRPLRVGTGAVRPAALPDHTFHEKHETVGPAALPDHLFHEKQDATAPAALPDHPFHEKEKQDAVRPAALPDHPSHEKQDAVQPTAEPDPDD